MKEEHHVFLSYSHKDTPIMQRVKDKIQSEGFMTWTDEGIEPGTPFWKDAIEHAIENTRCVVVILTPDAKNSIWIKRELDYAEAQKKTVFPILAGGDESNAIPFVLIGSQYIDLRADENNGIDKLILTLKRRIDISSRMTTIDAASNLQIASLLMRGAQGQSLYLSLDDMLTILNHAKSELERSYSQLVVIAEEQGFVKFENILEQFSNDINPTIFDELIKQLRTKNFTIVDEDQLVRIQIIQKGYENGFVTYDDILTSLNAKDFVGDFKLIDDIMDDLLEAGIEVLADGVDIFYQDAIDYIKQIEQVSIYALQRRFRITRLRAEKMIERLKTEGLIGSYDEKEKSHKVL